MVRSGSLETVGLVVPIGLYNTVKFQATAILLYLNDTDLYRADLLFDEEFWDQLQSFEKRLIDPCLRTLIEEGELALKVAFKEGNYPIYYQLDVSHKKLITRLPREVSKALH